jgi:hypothetical protein
MLNQSTHKVSIIIPHYNNFPILDECLKSLQETTYLNKEIIVVDNNSSDDSVALLSDNYKDIIIQKSPTNLGYAGGCNLGAEIATGEYLLFLNNDTIHDKSFLDKLANILNDDLDVACIQPKIKNYNNKESFDYAGASGGFIDYLVFPFCRGRIFDTIEKDKGQYDDDLNVFWTSGTAFLTRKNIFLIVEGFDTGLFAHMEEIDYSWKCHLAGYKCMVHPESIVYHHGAITLGYDSPYKTYLNHRNSMILLLTNYKLFKSLCLFLPRLILEIVSSINDLFKLKIFHFLAHYIAILSLLNIPFLYKRRSLNYKIRKVNDELINTIFKKSIVFKYFINRIKKFSSLNFI